MTRSKCLLQVAGETIDWKYRKQSKTKQKKTVSEDRIVHYFAKEEKNKQKQQQNLSNRKFIMRIFLNLAQIASHVVSFFLQNCLEHLQIEIFGIQYFWIAYKSTYMWHE